MADETAGKQIRARKRREMEQKQETEEGVVDAFAARLAPQPVQGTPQGRVVMGRRARIPCPLYPEQTDPDGTYHPQLYVIFRTDVQQKELDQKVVMAELSGLTRADDETQEQYRARVRAAAANLSYDTWCRRMAVRVIGFEGWDFLRRNEEGQLVPIPVPVPSDPASYGCLVEQGSELSALSVWCFLEGWEEALEASAKN